MGAPIEWMAPISGSYQKKNQSNFALGDVLLVPRSRSVAEKTLSTPSFVFVHPGGGIFLAATQAVTVRLSKSS